MKTILAVILGLATLLFCATATAENDSSSTNWIGLWSGTYKAVNRNDLRYHLDITFQSIKEDGQARVILHVESSSFSSPCVGRYPGIGLVKGDDFNLQISAEEIYRGSVAWCGSRLIEGKREGNAITGRIRGYDGVSWTTFSLKKE